MDAVMRGLRTDGGRWLVGLFELPAKLLVIALVVTTMSGCVGDDDDSGGDYTPSVYEPPDDSDPNDQEFDSVTDDSDNCPDNCNPDQTDGDGDGLGDLCDNCPGLENADQFDNDADGTGDACDECVNDPLKTEEGVCGCGMPDVDLDGDGQPDCEGTPTFTEQIIDDAISEGAQIELADLDGDGDLDVAAVDHYDRLQGPASPGQILWHAIPPGPKGSGSPTK